MPARAMKRTIGPEMPVSLLIDLHRDPERYARLVSELSARTGAAQDAERDARDAAAAVEARERLVGEREAAAVTTAADLHRRAQAVGAAETAMAQRDQAASDREVALDVRDHDLGVREAALADSARAALDAVRALLSAA